VIPASDLQRRSSRHPRRASSGRPARRCGSLLWRCVAIWFRSTRAGVETSALRWQRPPPRRFPYGQSGADSDPAGRGRAQGAVRPGPPAALRADRPEGRRDVRVRHADVGSPSRRFHTSRPNFARQACSSPNAVARGSITGLLMGRRRAGRPSAHLTRRREAANTSPTETAASTKQSPRSSGHGQACRRRLLQGLGQCVHCTSVPDVDVDHGACCNRRGAGLGRPTS
jgi:hypothetical protein